jgi:hypothetical protein
VGRKWGGREGWGGEGTSERGREGRRGEGEGAHLKSGEPRYKNVFLLGNCAFIILQAVHTTDTCLFSLY